MSLVYEIAARDIARQNARTAARSESVRRRARERARQPILRDLDSEPLVCPACLEEYPAGLSCPDCRTMLMERSLLSAARTDAAPATGERNPAPGAWIESTDLAALVRGRRKARWALGAGITGLALVLVALVAGQLLDSVFAGCLLYAPAAVFAALAVGAGRGVRWLRALGDVSVRHWRRAEVGFWCGLLTLLPSVYVAVALVAGIFGEDYGFFHF